MSHACPRCGYCPTCGRGSYPIYPRPWPYPRPYYWDTTVVPPHYWPTGQTISRALDVVRS